MNRPEAAPAAIGLDLGSTAIKAAVLDESGRLGPVRSVPSPPLAGDGPIREGNALAYAAAATRLVKQVADGLARGTPLGMASQRSTFTIWDGDDGRPRTPLISWQDRRAADWCDANRGIEAEVARRTGLPLSAHYAGPKLAAIRADPGLAPALTCGRPLFGNLDAFVLWLWTGGARHETDVTVAARTLLLDLDDEDWSPELLGHFGVARALLPRVAKSTRRSIPLEIGPRLEVSLADQAAGAIAVLGERDDTVLVNFGTGAFVLCPAMRESARKTGYLFAPILASGTSDTRFALEGTINGAGPAVDRFDSGPTELPEEDPAPDAFALPDLSGLGSPHWRPDLGLALSPAAERLAPAGRRRVVLEGLLFRVREILEDLCETGLPDRIVVSGGLSRDPALCPGLAALLAHGVDLLMERESGLLGASRLAAGMQPAAASPTRRVAPGAAGGYLRAKYCEWKGWYDALRTNA